VLHCVSGLHPRNACLSMKWRRRWATSICQLIVRQDAVPFCDHIIANCLMKGNAWTGEVPSRTKDGRESQTVFLNTPMMDSVGGLWGARHSGAPSAELRWVHASHVRLCT